MSTNSPLIVPTEAPTEGQTDMFTFIRDMMVGMTFEKEFIGGTITNVFITYGESGVDFDPEDDTQSPFLVFIELDTFPGKGLTFRMDEPFSIS